MDGKSLNLTQELLQQLQTIIPQAFSEGKLDTTALKTLLGEDVFVQGERYGLSWAGKSDAYKVLQQQTTTTLIPEPEQSVDWDNAQHVFIEGENLEVLKLLQKSYFGQVKMIYIDPPYNTGSDSFIYPDKFSETKEEYLQRIGDKNDEGYMLREGAFRPNRKESGQYHSNWLNMMLPRLYLARNLLRDDGVIFVSIDDNEQANLKNLLDEIFGPENFVGCAARVTKKSNNKGEFWAPNFDYVLTYTKNRECAKEFFGGANLSAYNLIEENGERKGEKYQLVRLYMSSIQNRNPEQRFYIECPDGSKVIPPGTTFPPERPNLGDGIWRWSRKKIEAEWDKIVVKEVRSSNLINEYGEPAKYNVFTKTYLNDVIANSSAKPNSFIEEYINQLSSHELNSLDIPFDYAKPVGLIQYLSKIAQITENDIVLDFFAGSGTTAQAVMELNEEDSGNRRYICVQLPEKTDENSEAAKADYATIADITAARIKKVIAKIEAERATKTDLLNDSKPLPNLGFRKFTLAPSNFKLWRGDVIESEEELLRQMRLFATPQRANATTPDMAWELLLKSGYDLTEAVTALTLADGLKVYHTADKRLALVLDGFSAAVQVAVLQLKPKQVLLLDSVFAGQENGDSVKTNAQLTFEDQGVAFRTV